MRFSVSRMYNLRMLYVPLESVTVIFALGRSRMTVSFTPDVIAGPLPAVPGNRGTGSTPPDTAGYLARRSVRRRRRRIAVRVAADWLSAVPIGHRAPIAARIVPPNGRHHHVFHVLDVTMRHVPVDAVSTVLNPGIDCTLPYCHIPHGELLP